MAYRYYMTMRPPMPGAQPSKGLDIIEERDPNDIIPYLGRGVYAVLTYTRKLTEKEVHDYELLPDEDED